MPAWDWSRLSSWQKKNAHVIIGCRSLDKGQQAVKEIRERSGKPSVTFIPLELGSFNSIDKFVEEFLKQFDRLDVLMLNAGKFFEQYSETEEGFEINIGVHHMGHAYLTFLLLPLLRKQKTTSRIVVVASHAHFDSPNQIINYATLNDKTAYSSLGYYCQSKLANILFTKRLAVELERRGVSNVLVNSLHPGFVITDFSWIQRTIVARYLAYTAEEGALTQLYVATHPNIDIQHINGGYFYPIARHAVYGVDSAWVTTQWEHGDQLWDYTMAALRQHRPNLQPLP